MGSTPSTTSEHRLAGRSPRPWIPATAVLVVAVALLAWPALLPSSAANGSAPPGSPAATLSVATSGGNASSWQNITSTVGNSPSLRSNSQMAYSPALNETILFGGYVGIGGNAFFNDTWSFSSNHWKELFPARAPVPRSGAGLVYDPAARALVLFGGRNDTGFFNDTWEFNATGWHNVSTTVAPSPRYDFGMAYDPAVGGIVLFGGGIGNVPAGTFTNFTFYNDTWTFVNGIWKNITASAGTPPPGRLMRYQMAYDAGDGELVLTGGFMPVPYGTEGPCGYQTFDPSWGTTWTFAEGVWSEAHPAGPSPPPGMGTVWFDSEANETLYYEGMWSRGGVCDVSGNQVWAFSAGNWTLVTEGNISAPVAREGTIFVDDVGDDEQVEFGGEISATATEYGAGYLNDTWTYQPTWVTFHESGAPTETEWKVKIAGAANTTSSGPLVFVVAPGTYSYVAQATVDGTEKGTESGSVTLAHGPIAVALVYGRLTTPPTSSFPAARSLPWELSLVVLAAVLAALGAGALGWFGASRREARLRSEGDELVDRMRTQARDDGTDRFEGR